MINENQFGLNNAGIHQTTTAIIELSEDYFIFSNAPQIVTHMPIESITYVKFSEIKQSNIGCLYFAVILFILGTISIIVPAPAHRQSYALGAFVIIASVFSYIIYIFSKREFRGIELYSYGFVEKLNMTSLKAEEVLNLVQIIKQNRNNKIKKINQYA